MATATLQSQVESLIGHYYNPKSIADWAKQIDYDIKDDINSLRLLIPLIDSDVIDEIITIEAGQKAATADTLIQKTATSAAAVAAGGVSKLQKLINAIADLNAVPPPTDAADAVKDAKAALNTEVTAIKKELKDSITAYIILVTKLNKYFTSKNLTITETVITEQLDNIAKNPPSSPPNYSIKDFDPSKLDITPTIGPIDTSKQEGIDKLIKDLKKLLTDATQTPVLDKDVIGEKIAEEFKKLIIKKLEALKELDAIKNATGTSTTSAPPDVLTKINEINKLLGLINTPPVLNQLNTTIAATGSALKGALNKTVIDAHIVEVKALQSITLTKTLTLDDTKDLQIQLLILLKEFLTKNPELKLTTPEAIAAAIQAFVDKLPKTLSQNKDNTAILNSIISALALTPAQKYKFEKAKETPESIDSILTDGLNDFFGNDRTKFYKAKEEAPDEYGHVKASLKYIKNKRTQLEKATLGPIQQLSEILLRVPVDSAKKVLERMTAILNGEDTIRGIGELTKKGGGRRHRHKRMRGGALASENAANFLIEYIKANKATGAAPGAATVDADAIASLISDPRTATSSNALDNKIDLRIDAKITALEAKINIGNYALKTELEELKQEIIGAINIAEIPTTPPIPPTPPTIVSALQALLEKVRVAIEAAPAPVVVPDATAAEGRLAATEAGLAAAEAGLAELSAKPIGATAEQLAAAEARLAATAEQLAAAEARLAAAEGRLGEANIANTTALAESQAANATALAAALAAAKTELGEANAAALREAAAAQAAAQAAARVTAEEAQRQLAAAQQAQQLEAIAAIRRDFQALQAAAPSATLPPDLEAKLTSIEAKVATVEKIVDDLAELTGRVVILEEQIKNVNKIQEHLASIDKKITAALTAAGGSMRGGVEKVELPKDPMLVLKEKKGNMEEYKKEIRQLIANADGYKTRILEQFVKNIKESLPKESDNLLTTSKIDLLILKLETVTKPPAAPPASSGQQAPPAAQGQTISRSDLTAIYNAEPVSSYEETITPDKAQSYIGDLKAKRSDIANVEKKMLGTYDYLDKEGKNFKETIQKSITEDRKTLKEVTDKVITLMDEEPQLNRTWANKMIGLIKQRLTGIDPITNNEKPEEGLDTMYTTLVNSLKTIYEDAYTKIKPIAEGIIREQKQAVELAKAQSTKFVRGGRSSPKRRYYGGETTVEAEGNKIENVLNEASASNIKGNLNSILNDVFNDIYKQYTRRMNPTMMAANAASPPTLYQMIYRKYTDRAPDDPYGAAEELSQGLKINNLVPKEALEITRNDRIVFIFVTLFLRLFAVNITNWAIDKDYFVTLQSAFIMYLVTYSILLLLFVGIVNFDMYRMRIVFNYVNLHANRPRIMSHLFAFWVFAFFIYLYFNAINSLSNVDSKNIPQKPSSLGDEEKARLQYKVQMLTIILWLLLIVMIILI